MKFHESSTDSNEFSAPPTINNARHPWYGVNARYAICALHTKSAICYGLLGLPTDGVGLLGSAHDVHKSPLDLAANRAKHNVTLLFR